MNSFIDAFRDFCRKFLKGFLPKRSIKEYGFLSRFLQENLHFYVFMPDFDGIPSLIPSEFFQELGSLTITSRIFSASSYDSFHEVPLGIFVGIALKNPGRILSAILADIPSEIPAEITSQIPPGILSKIYAGIYSKNFNGILSGIRAGMPAAIASKILPVIFFFRDSSLDFFRKLSSNSSRVLFYPFFQKFLPEIPFEILSDMPPKIPLGNPQKIPSGISAEIALENLERRENVLVGIPLGMTIDGIPSRISSTILYKDSFRAYC